MPNWSAGARSSRRRRSARSKAYRRRRAARIKNGDYQSRRLARVLGQKGWKRPWMLEFVTCVYSCGTLLPVINWRVSNASVGRPSSYCLIHTRKMPMKTQSLSAMAAALLAALPLVSTLSLAADSACQSRAATAPRVIELYTSEGCSSCPPADKWLSGLKNDKALEGAVIQSFHVSYWDDLGWVDRFAKPEFNLRQRQIAAWQRSRSVYTPQIVNNGSDAPLRSLFSSPSKSDATKSPASFDVVVTSENKNSFRAEVTVVNTNQAWAAYWTVTEDGHSSKVRAGENRGESLQHDYVVRQYVTVPTQKGNAKLRFDAGPADPAHPRRVNFVVFSPETGKPIQAVPLAC